MKQLKQTSLILITSLFFTGIAQADETLWKSGGSLFIKLAEQDKSRREATPPNQHPVQLNADEITNALNSIDVWDDGLFKKRELSNLFSVSQARLLGQYISVGLAKATSNQDITFTLANAEKKYLVLQETYFTAGRVFYLNNRLHLIIGDYRKLPDKFKERVYSSSGVTDISHYFTIGRRSKQSRFKQTIVNRSGVAGYTEGAKERRDWIVIDLSRASTAYIAGRKSKELKRETITNEVLQAEAARLARERREMRLELARMRKEIREAANGGSSLSVEERLTTLEELKNKKLISDEEYQLKRKQILSEI